jgi:hypothetical protein
MKTSIAFLIAAGSASAFAPSEPSSRTSVTLSETKESLVELAVKLNPIVKFYDP